MKRIALAGFGVENRSVYRYLLLQDNIELVIFDQAESLADAPDGVQLVLGPDAFSRIDASFDVIYRSPAVRPTDLPEGAKVATATSEFFSRFNHTNHIIGVTGTKGKGTTTSLIHEILVASGKRSHLVGNIGAPALDVAKDIKKGDIVCYEMSSFQLWDLQSSPNTAVVLMIEPDHLDNHKDMDDYLAAKSHIVRSQSLSDRVVMHPSNELTEQVALFDNQLADVVRYMDTTNPLAASLALIDGDEWIVIDEQRICKADDVALIGRHNLENICAAITAVWPLLESTNMVAKTLMEFGGLEHRIHLFNTIGNIDYYDDSYAAAPSACVVALKAMKKPTVAIIGGKNRGGNMDFKPIIETVVSERVKHVILIGETSTLMGNMLKESGFTSFSRVSSMQEAVDVARAVADDGDAIILTPGAPSFDMYDNYIQRAEDFIGCVNA